MVGRLIMIIYWSKKKKLMMSLNKVPNWDIFETQEQAAEKKPD